MKTRMTFVAALALVLLGSVVPIAQATPTVGSRRWHRSRSNRFVDALEAVGSDATADVFGGKVVGRGGHPYVGMVLLLNRGPARSSRPVAAL